MDQLPRAIVFAAIIVSGALLLHGLYPADRYSMVAAQGGAFRVDRLTGAVIFCDAVICRSLPLATFTPAQPKPLPPNAPPSGT